MGMGFSGTRLAEGVVGFHGPERVALSEVFTTPAFEVVAVWIPPGGTELTVEEEQSVPGRLPALVGERAPLLQELFRRFDAAHPRHEPHYYLSLLAVADAHRGRGLGMALLRENLARFEAKFALAQNA